MKKYTGVIGTMKTVPTLEVNVTTVYIRSNIKEIDYRGRKAWQYDEIQYDLREYQEDLGVKTETLAEDSNAVAELMALSLEDSVVSAELLATILEDTASVSEMMAMLIEQNALLTQKIELLEGGKQ